MINIPSVNNTGGRVSRCIVVLPSLINVVLGSLHHHGDQLIWLLTILNAFYRQGHKETFQRSHNAHSEHLVYAWHCMYPFRSVTGKQFNVLQEALLTLLAGNREF